MASLLGLEDEVLVATPLWHLSSTILEWVLAQLSGSLRLDVFCYGIHVDLAGVLRKKKEAYNGLHGALLLQCFALSNSLLITVAGRGSSYVLSCRFLKNFVLLC